MNALASTLQAFFTDRLIRQRQASPHTVTSYRDTLRLFLSFAAQQRGVQLSELQLEDLDAERIDTFLQHLEQERGNSARTCNARLAAIHSFYRFAQIGHPEYASAIDRVLAIPQKRWERNLVTFLSEVEVAALLAAPDRKTWTGRRDHAILALAAQTGLRASEILALRCTDCQLGSKPHVQCLGKGRKARLTPLTNSVRAVLRTWLSERAARREDLIFTTSTGDALSRDALERRVAKHSTCAAKSCPSLREKRVTPHVLRHTAAMRLLQGGVDISLIALWLGHEQTETTQIYLHADLAIKERALAKTAPAGIKPGRYRPPDPLLAFLESL